MHRTIGRGPCLEPEFEAILRELLAAIRADTEFSSHLLSCTASGLPSWWLEGCTYRRLVTAYQKAEKLVGEEK